MKRRALLLALLAPLAGGAARAQPDWQRVAVPLVTPQAFVAALWRQHGLARARTLAAVADAFAQASRSGAAREALREPWLALLQAWAALHAVAIGPLLQRRSAVRIDFAPTRTGQVLLLAGRLAAGSVDPTAVGGSAKGLGALEWLLFGRDAPQALTQQQNLLAFLADDIATEASALVAAFDAALAQGFDEEARATAAYAEAVNQWIGGWQTLRLAAFERPLIAALQRGKPTLPGSQRGKPTLPGSQRGKPTLPGSQRGKLTLPGSQRGKLTLPRALSGAAAAEREARLQALLAVTRYAAGEPASIESLLRGRGLNPLAGRLLQAAGRARSAVERAGADAASLQQASRALAAVKHLAESDVAPALDVRVAFSDADGD